jgi:hypothetical protein
MLKHRNGSLSTHIPDLVPLEWDHLGVPFWHPGNRPFLEGLDRKIPNSPFL